MGRAAALMLLSVPLTIGGVPQTWLDALCVCAIASIVAVVIVRVGLLALTRKNTKSERTRTY